MKSKCIIADYISRVPSPDQWTYKIGRLDLLHSDNYACWIKSLVGGEHLAVRDILAPQQTNSFLELAQEYARITQARNDYSNKSTAFARFQNLILLSICLILRTKCSNEAVERLISWTGKSQKQCRAILRGTERVHRAVTALKLCGWEMSRATELFLIVPLSFSSLILLSYTKPDEFATELATKAVNPDDLGNSRRPRTVPHYTFLSLIADLVHSHGISVDDGEIQRALGYPCTSTIRRCEPVVSLDVHVDLEWPRPPKRKAEEACTSGGPQRQEAEGTQRLQAIAEPRQLLHLLRSLKVERFPEQLLKRGCTEQRRWDSNGQVRAIRLAECDVLRAYAPHFQCIDTLEASLQSCVEIKGIERLRESSASIIRIKNDGFVKPGGHHHAVVGLMFLCHICPQEQYLDSDFHAVAEQILPAMCAWLQDLRPESSLLQQNTIRNSVVATCLAIARANHLPMSHNTYTIASALCKSGALEHYTLELASMRSMELRKRADYDGSDRVIQDVMNTSISGIRSKYWLSQLYLSMAENRILQNDYAAAEQWAHRVDVPDRPECESPMLWRLLEQKWMFLGRLFRYGGKFSDAKDVLKLCLDNRRLSGRNVTTVLRQLADIYLELDQPQEAKALLQPYLAKYEDQGAVWTSYYRLLLSYADADIMIGNLEDAQQMLHRIENHFRRRKPISPTEQLDHVRSAISSMRIALSRSDWVEGVQRATAALGLTNYPSFTENNCYKGYIHAARAACCSHLAASDIELAKQRVLEPRHYMAGIGTYDRSQTLRCLQSGLELSRSIREIPLGRSEPWTVTL